MAGVRLKWLKIEKYRNVAPGTELRFGEGFNVLLGKNGTGKTTLLKLIAMIVRDELAPLADSLFDFSYTLAFRDAEVDVHVKNERREPRSSLNVPHPAWFYGVSFRPTNGSSSWQIRATHEGVVLSPTVNNKFTQQRPTSPSSPFDDRFLLVVLPWFKYAMPDDDPDHELLNSAWRVMARVNGGRFDESLGGFVALTEADSVSAKRELRSANVEITAENSGKMLSAKLTFAPGEIWDAVKLKELGETIPLQHVELEFLRKAIDAMNFKDAEMLMRRRRKTVDKPSGEQTVSYGGFEFNFTLRDGEVIRHEDLSYGQKRLLSFLYYAACNPDIIIADELVNGLHHAWVQASLNLIVGRQSFLTSQNPLLLDFLFFDSAKEVEETFIVCTMEERDSGGQFVWKNLSPETAASFYRAYQAGIQHVSEILSTKGLW